MARTNLTEAGMSAQASSATDIIEKQSPHERRGAVRRNCCRKCNVWPEGASGATAWPGIIYNISTSGIGVVLPCPLIAGTTLVIELFGAKQELRVRARVVRSALQSFAFFQGCEFLEPLDERQVQSWLR